MVPSSLFLSTNDMIKIWDNMDSILINFNFRDISINIEIKYPYQSIFM